MARAFKVIVVLVVIGALAAIAYKRGHPHRVVRHPLATELERIHADATRLHADVSAHIQSLDAARTTIGRSINSVNERVVGIQGRVEQTQVELAQKQQAIGKYSTLVAMDQGAILPDGQYMSAEVVRRQFEFEQQQVNSLRQRLALVRQHLDNAERILRSCQERYERTNATLARLRAARSQLQEQLAHLDLMLKSFTEEALAQSVFQNDLRRLQSDITSIQDQLNVHLRELPEILALEPAEHPEILLNR